jgi:hypothetical protein
VPAPAASSPAAPTTSTRASTPLRSACKRQRAAGSSSSRRRYARSRLSSRKTLCNTFWKQDKAFKSLLLSREPSASFADSALCTGSRKSTGHSTGSWPCYATPTARACAIRKTYRNNSGAAPRRACERATGRASERASLADYHTVPFYSSTDNAKKIRFP